MSGSKKVVLVIGNGATGSQLVAKLAKLNKYQIIVLTPFEYMEMPFRLTKVIASDPDYVEHNKSLYDLVREDNTEYVIDYATALTNDSCVTSTGKVIQFDVCVIATGIGGTHATPKVTEKTLEDRRNNVKEVQQSIKEAKHIVISGGGAIGVELAGDIKIRNPDKVVTVVESNDKILKAMPDAFIEKVNGALTKIGVNVILNDRVVEHQSKMVALKSGKSLECDVYLPSFSNEVHSNFVPEEFKSDRGFIKVNEFCQVERANKLFALGAISAVLNNKAYVGSEDQIPTVYNNVLAYLDKKPLKKYVPSMMGKATAPLLIAIGHDHPDGYGVGPNVPDCCIATCVWCCCICGGPCHTPAGKGVLNMSNDWHKSWRVVKGHGYVANAKLPDNSYAVVASQSMNR